MNEFVVENDKKKSIKLVLLSIIMIIACIFVFIVSMVERSLLVFILGAISTTFFIASFIFIVKRAIKSTPLLIINDAGITDTSTAFSVGFISWDEIKFVRIQQSQNQKFIGVFVNDVNTIMNRVPLLKRLIIKANLALNYAPISISLNTANTDLSKVLSLIRSKLKEHQIDL